MTQYCNFISEQFARMKKRTQVTENNRVSIAFASKRLGVTPGHLRFVLRGERHSPKLLARYQDYLAAMARLDEATMAGGPAR